MPFITKLGAVAARAYGWIATTVSAAVNDTYFYLVSMLLPGNGTNGAQNNTFLDSSTNNFTITRNGNTTQGTFSPFSQTGWSNYFDGSGDYLTIANTTAIQVGASNFTFEAWVYPLSLPSSGNYKTLWAKRANSAGFGGACLVLDSSGNFLFFVASSASAWGLNGSSTGHTVSTNTWQHLAMVRSGNALILYKNGIAGTTVTLNFTVYDGTSPLSLMSGGADGTQAVDGYMSNFRLVNGTAVYTSSFTPPATPLTAVSGTSLLTCQSNRIVDNSANNFTITRNGDVAVQAFSPFVPNNISPTSYSGWFDGSGDYLSLADSSAWTLGTNNFTIEFWINFLASDGSVQNIAGQSGSLGDYSNQSFVFYRDANNKINGYVVSGGATAYTCTSTASVTQNTWRHVALVRNNNTLTLYLDGSANGTANLTGVTVTNSSSALSIGRVGDYATSPINGYISNFRLVNGTAVYTSNFTPPTVPLTAIANTSLLTCQNATFIDNSTNAFAITVNGNAQPITTNPFQTPSPNPISYSGYFDGTGDYLSIPSNAAFTLGAGDFTIDVWIYTANITNTYSRSIAATYSFVSSLDRGWFLSLTSTGYPQFGLYNSSGVQQFTIVSSVITPTNQWTHLAAVRSGSAVKLYLNGVQVGSATSSANDTVQVSDFTIGTIRSDNLTPAIGNSGTSFLGYISNLRIVKGTALYTANFIPSNTPLTAVSGTSLLTCQDNRFVDNSTNAFAITVNGNTTPVMTNPYGYATPISSTAYGGAFDGGTTTRLTFPSNTAFAFGAGAYTMEAWVYLTSYATTFSTAIFDCGSTTNSAGMFVTTSGALFLNLYGVGSVIQTSTTIPLNTWTHIAISRQSTAASSTRLFINGVLGATGTDSNNWTVTTTPSVGGIGLAGYTVSGFVSNVRIVKGTAVYTAAFTPSTTPLTAIANTSLLTCQNIVFADNSSNAFTVTVNGNTAPTPVNPFGYSAPTAPTPISYSALTNGGSGYFDGSGDYLSIASNAAFNFGTGDFTIEFWLFLPSPSTTQVFLDIRNAGVGLVFYSSGGVLYVNKDNSGSVLITGGSLTGSTWLHIALSRSSGANKLFINGAQSGSTATDSTNYPTNPVYIGGNFSGGQPTTGYLSSLRIIKGTALYTAAFAPPVLPFTAVSNTQLLLNYTNAGIADAASQNVLETVGNAQISTAQSKWGGGSMAFDGTGDYLYQPNQVNLQFRTGPYTIEFWIYPNSFSPLPVILDMRTVNAATGGAIQIYITTGGVVTVYGGSNTGTLLVTAGSALSTGVWAHVALTRSGTSTRLFINGTQSGSTATDSTDYGLGALWLGVIASGNNSYFNGYIDDLRITKFARYTANFTPPTAAFPTQ